MDPKSLIPAAEAIPVPWGWFELLSLATFALHLLFMNTVLGSGVIALVNHLRGTGEAVNRDLSRRLPTVLALTVNLGVPPLLFMQVLYGQYLYTSSVLMAWFWLSVVGTVMSAYSLLYAWDFTFDVLPRGGRVLVLGVAVGLLLATAFIYVNNMTLMLRPEAWTAYFQNPDGTILNTADPTFWPRFLHFLLAALAVGGLFVAVSAHLSAGKPSGMTPEQAEAAKALGLRWFTRATMAAMAAGAWWLMALKTEIMLGFMGQNLPATILFLAALSLAVAALVAGVRGQAVPAAWLTAATVLAMAGVRAFLRAFTLAPYSRVSDLPVTGEYSPLVLFLATFAVGLAALGYMIRLYLRAGKEV